MSTLELPYRVVVAIDFGTSRSGYALAFLRDRQVIREQDWPDQPYPVVKTLTRLLYDPHGHLAGWGFSAFRFAVQLRAEHKSKGYRFFHAFKLALRTGASSRRGPLFDPHDGHAAVPVVDLIVAYLAQMKELIMSRLKHATTTGLSEGDIFWCLTVPAAWETEQKRRMREAAQKAGLIGRGPEEARRLCLILEPEAAALYCLHKDAASGVSMLQPGTRFMVVDAGGGTIDLTVHEVTAHGGLDEVICANSATCGSTGIDQAFRRYLNQRFGAQAIKEFHRLRPMDWRLLMDDWERAKCGYDPGSPYRYTNITFPPDLARILKAHHEAIYREFRSSQQKEISYLRLDKATMKRLFEPIIEQTVGVVQEQFQRLGGTRLDYVFLVGGFAQSPLLQQRLREAVGDRARIVIPAEPGAAVVLGAVLYGLGPEQIAHRRSRYTYGIRILAPFQPSVDPEARKVSKGESGDWCERFCPFVEQGQLIGVDHKVDYLFEPLRLGQEQATFKFYAVDGPAPTYFEGKMTPVDELTIPIPEEARHRKLTIKVSLYFGRTEIAAEATDSLTGESLIRMLDFRSDLTHQQKS